MVGLQLALIHKIRYKGTNPYSTPFGHFQFLGFVVQNPKLILTLRHKLSKFSR